MVLMNFFPRLIKIFPLRQRRCVQVRSVLEINNKDFQILWNDAGHCYILNDESSFYVAPDIRHLL